MNLTVNVSSTAPSTLTNTASVSGGGDSNSANNSASDVTTIRTAADTQPPTAPGNLNATAVGGNQINLAWNASTDNTGVAAYRLERCQGAGCSSFSEIGTQGAGQITDPLSASSNPNYFKDGTGKPVILSGSQTWNSLQDWGTNGSPQPFDFTAFVNFLTAHGHNFTLLWHIELPKFCDLPTTSISPPDFTVGPHPWRRTGPGTATDGGPTFDLTQFDQSYFDRLRTRVQSLNAANIYAGVYLFTGEYLNTHRCSSDGYPFTGSNNVNGIDDGGGIGSMTMTSSNALTSFQDAYVQKVIDTLNDLPNVLWIVSEEAPANTDWWHAHLISLIHSYESGKPFRHPVGYAVRSDSNDSTLMNSDADWIAPVARISPTASCGSGMPLCKVNINDSDHSYYGMWNDTPQTNRNYAWENFTNGNQVLFMDPYWVYYPRESRNLCLAPINGICSGPDTRWDNFRNNLGAILSYSRRLNLSNVTPMSSLCSTSNCLAQTPSVGAEYLIYSPNGGSFTVNLSAMSSSRTLTVEWFNPSTGAVVPAGSVPAGSFSWSFTPPFSGDAVLYLVDSSGHAAAQSLITSTSFSDTGLQSVQDYSYRVRAADVAGNLSAYSNVASAATSSSDVISPSAPSGVLAIPFSSSQINLTWTASTDNIAAVTEYWLERCQGAGCSSFTALPTPASSVSYSDSGLTAATSYSYRIRARDAAGNLSPYSAIASAITLVSSAAGAITLVQHQAQDAGTTVSTSLAFGSSNTAGNFIAVAIRSGRSGETFAVSDSRGNAYRQAVLLNVTLDTPNGDTLAIYYAENTGGGTNIVTISQSLSATMRFAIFEYAGVSSANSLDCIASAQANGALASSGNVMTSAADLVLGAVISADYRAFTAGTNFTIEDRVPSASSTKLITEDWIQTSAGSGAATAGLSSTDVWGAVVAAFRPSKQ
jgi:chitodextrinase